jgi:hypothetical protein
VLLLFFPVPPDLVVLFTLAIALYLTVIELRELRSRPHFLWWSWWLLLVFMTHFVGYLALRGYAFYRRRSEARA